MSNKYTTVTHKNTKEEPLYVCILTGTAGYREKTKGVRVMRTLGDCSILEGQLNTLRHCYPKANVTITTGFQADRIIKIKPDNVSIIENQLFEELNTAEEIRLLLNSINPSRLLLIDGAIFFDEESIRNITETSSVFMYRNNDIQDIGLKYEDGNVINFAYGLTEKWAGLVYLEGEALSVLKKIATRENNKLCLHELLNILLQRKIELKVISSNKSKLVKF